ncbi:hypothetical protein SD22575_0566 [Shigella dysenteriae 225-75]|nr:hypothetical protein SD22575_0566 [Shigella dysenteriae 225-75]
MVSNVAAGQFQFISTESFSIELINILDLPLYFQTSVIT